MILIESAARSAVCTLYEGDYHLGVAALANSLYLGGFRGKLWIGGRGHRPDWLKDGRPCGENQFSFDGMTLHFVDVRTSLFLAQYKPEFMLDVFRVYDPNLQQLFYFDPDIVCQAQWSFFTDWARRGIALVEDGCYARFPSNHPIRLRWQDFLVAAGEAVSRSCESYYNSGFVGVSADRISFLDLWKRLMEMSYNSGADRALLKGRSREDLFFNYDQDTMNIACLGTEHSLSTVGPDGMGFSPAGFIMQHAVDSPKAWRKRYLMRLLRRGDRPSMAHVAFWQNVDGPIRPFSRLQKAAHRLDMRLAIGASRFYQA
jgi:hypothetical protein